MIRVMKRKEKVFLDPFTLLQKIVVHVDMDDALQGAQDFISGKVRRSYDIIQINIF